MFRGKVPQTIYPGRLLLLRYGLREPVVVLGFVVYVGPLGVWGLLYSFTKKDGKRSGVWCGIGSVVLMNGEMQEGKVL